MNYLVSFGTFAFDIKTHKNIKQYKEVNGNNLIAKWKIQRLEIKQLNGNIMFIKSQN